MRVAAVVGASNSGKTTLIVALIRHFISLGQKVGAIKHTHHAINERREGDTARLAAAGCEIVILAGDGEAIIFLPSDTERIRYKDPADLMAVFDVDIVFIEGFKNVDRWPRLDLDRHRGLSVNDALVMLDRDVSF